MSSGAHRGTGTGAAFTTPVVVCGTVIVLAVLASVTALSWAGRDTAELLRLVNSAAGIIGSILGGGALVYARAGAQRADGAKAAAEQAAEQTNGQMDDRIHTAVMMALAEYQQQQQRQR